MECDRGHLHHNANHSHIELIPLPGDRAPGRATVLVTTLGRAWMPLVRYELGDAVRMADGVCGCGLPENGYLLARVEGRASDIAFGHTAAEIDDWSPRPTRRPVEGVRLLRDKVRLVSGNARPAGRRSCSASKRRRARNGGRPRRVRPRPGCRLFAGAQQRRRRLPGKIWRYHRKRSSDGTLTFLPGYANHNAAAAHDYYCNTATAMTGVNAPQTMPHPHGRREEYAPLSADVNKAAPAHIGNVATEIRPFAQYR